jgi:hypothetical protein
MSSANSITIVIPTFGRPYRTALQGDYLKALQNIVGGAIQGLNPKTKTIHPLFLDAHPSWKVAQKVFEKKLKTKMWGNENGMNECDPNMAVVSVDGWGVNHTWGNLAIVMTKKQSEKIPEIASLPFYRNCDEALEAIEE